MCVDDSKYFMWYVCSQHVTVKSCTIGFVPRGLVGKTSVRYNDVLRSSHSMENFLLGWQFRHLSNTILKFDFHFKHLHILIQTLKFIT